MLLPAEEPWWYSHTLFFWHTLGCFGDKSRRLHLMLITSSLVRGYYLFFLKWPWQSHAPVPASSFTTNWWKFSAAESTVWSWSWSSGCFMGLCRRTEPIQKHGTSMFDVFLSKYQTAANLRPPRRFSCITKENIQVGTKRRVLCKKAPKYKERTACRLLVPKSRRKAYVRVQFTSCLCVCAKKTIARTCPCMHICHTRTVCSHK